MEADARAAEAARPQSDPIPVNLSTVSVKQAERLAGRHVLVTFDLLGNDDGRGGYVVYSNDGPDDDEDHDVERSVWESKGRRVRQKDAALGTLTVIRYPTANGSDGTAFSGYIELRVVLDS